MFFYILTRLFAKRSIKLPLSFSLPRCYNLFDEIKRYPQKKVVNSMKRSSAPPTMKDVAREAGVSLGTVSKVINGIPVGESYRRRVEAATKKLGYQVNSYARGLKTNKTNTAALLVPSLLHPFYAELTDELTASLMHRGYRPILMITNYDIEAEQKCISLVRQNKVDGIIGLTYNPYLEVDESLPFVSIDRHFKASVPCVCSDNYGGGQMAAEKLLELGCKRLLFMRIGPDVYGEADKRVSGFENICRLRGIDHESILLNDRDTEEPFFRYLREHIHDGRPDFDGIFCNTDGLASHVCACLAAEGVDVPGQVQVIGYDGITDFATGGYYCSTIVQPIRRMAETAVELLLGGGIASAPSIVCLPVHYAPGGTTKDSL